MDTVPRWTLYIKVRSTFWKLAGRHYTVLPERWIDLAVPEGTYEVLTDRCSADCASGFCIIIIFNNNDHQVFSGWMHTDAFKKMPLFPLFSGRNITGCPLFAWCALWGEKRKRENDFLFPFIYRVRVHLFLHLTFRNGDVPSGFEVCEQARNGGRADGW